MHACGGWRIMHAFVYYPAVLCRKNREFADETFTRVQKPVRLLSAISDYYINISESGQRSRVFDSALGKVQPVQTESLANKTAAADWR